MGALEVPVVGVGAEALEAYLSSDRSPPDSMGLSDLDGFLTAVAIGPELVMPSEWLPIVWGGEEPVFADDGEAQAVIGGIMSRLGAAAPLEATRAAPLSDLRALRRRAWRVPARPRPGG